MKKIIIIVAAVLLIVAIAGFVVCFFTVDMPMVYDYSVAVADDNARALRVSLTVSAPLFCRQDAAYIYLGDKDVNVLGCFDGRGNSKETFLYDGIIAAPVSRAGKTVIVYDVPVGLPVKHGGRGTISDDCVIFDGDQAFLLPAPFYIYDDEGIRQSVGTMRFTFDFPEDWVEIVPFTEIDNPGWSDIYALHKNAFVFGKFDSILQTETGLNVYAPENSGITDTSGFSEFFDYYSGLFESAPSEYNIVLLPSENQDDNIIGSDGSGISSDRIIGGAGTAVTAASFNFDSLRDWQLLSHRLFHAFYDTAAPYVNAHITPNVWFNEGLSTYYENMAMGALPESLRSRLGVDVDRQFALIFDQYLYMRIRDPYVYTFAPMDEAELESDALTEFLHYTVAPLIVKLLIDESVKLGKDPNALLRYCLTEHESPITPFWAALEMLGDDSQSFCEAYMLGTSIPPLWYLKRSQPSSNDVLNALNNIEILMESWWLLENDSYRVHVVTEEHLAEAMRDLSKNQVEFLPPEMADLFFDYCPEVYALLNDYYWQAQEKGIAFDDKDIRGKL